MNAIVLSDFSGRLSSGYWGRGLCSRQEAAACFMAPGPNGSDRLMGFGIQPERWTLHYPEPAFVAGSDWPEILPDLASEVRMESWAEAWKALCQSLNPPVAETEADVQDKTGLRLTIKVSRRFMDWLRATRSDLLKGEGWLLVGQGRARAAAVIKLI